MSLDSKALDEAVAKPVEPEIDQHALLIADDVWRIATVGPMTTKILTRCITAYLTAALPAVVAAAERRGAEGMRERCALAVNIDPTTWISNNSVPVWRRALSDAAVAIRALPLPGDGM